MNRILLILFFITSQAILSACSNPFGSGSSAVDPGYNAGLPPLPPVYPPGKGTDFISSSVQNVVTKQAGLPSGYIVSQSLGGLAQGITGTTAGGYNYYMNVQGSLISH